MDGSTSAALRQNGKVEIPVGSLNQKEPPATVRPILFCKRAVYGEPNSEIVRFKRTYGVMREHESVSRDSTAAATNSRGNYNDLCASCGKGRAECCDRLYHTDGLTGTAGIFVFR
jgi:hypothetical protein